MGLRPVVSGMKNREDGGFDRTPFLVGDRNELLKSLEKCFSHGDSVLPIPVFVFLHTALNLFPADLHQIVV